MRFVKVNETFYTDLDDVASLFIDVNKEYNNDRKKVVCALNVFAVDKNGQKVPFPLYWHEFDENDKESFEKAQDKCDEFIELNFLGGNKR